MTPDDFTPNYKRRRVLGRAGLAAGASTLPSACCAVTFGSQEADAIAPPATPKAALVTPSPPGSLGTTQAVSTGSVWNLEQIQRSVQLRISIFNAELARVSHRRQRLSENWADSIRMLIFT